MNINNETDKEKYKHNFFTEQGYNTLNNYLKNLILKYIETQDYPTKIGIVFGIPLFQYSDNIISHQELLGRIKQLGQILGVKDVSFKTNDNKNVFFLMTGEFTIQ